MKKKVSLMLLLLMLTFTSGCGFVERIFSDNNYQITFVVDGKEVNTIEVSKNDVISSLIKDPIKENYIFNGWFTKTDEKFDFDKPIKENLYVYANYTPDYNAIINKVSQSSIKANVEIQAKSYNTFLGTESQSSLSLGSGVIFYEKDNYYYVLTNSHVVYPQTSYKYIKYTIEDYSGNAYDASLYNNSIDPSYDLAIITFKKMTTELLVVKIESNNPIIGDDVIAIGQPKGQDNAITFGKVSSFRKVTLNKPSESSKVIFPVIVHDAPTDDGSSGGALLNFSLKLVGISFAGSKTEDNEFNKSYAIPIEKLIEYLELYFRKWN